MPEVLKAFNDKKTLTKSDIITAKLVYPEPGANATDLEKEALKDQAKIVFRDEQRRQEKRWTEIEKFLKTAYSNLKNSCHTNFEVSLKRSPDWETIDNSQDLFALWDLIKETCQAGGSTDQVDEDITCFQVTKEIAELSTTDRRR